jgi:hypothetical protein
MAAAGHVVVELQHVDHAHGGPDGSELRHGLGPGALVGPERGSEEALCPHQVGQIYDRLAEV